LEKKTMQDVLSIAQAFVDAWKARDAARVMQHMAEDSHVYIIPPFPETPPEFHGREQIAMFVNGFIQGFQGDFSNFAADGNRATFYGRLTADGVKAAGIDEVDQNDELVLVDGKVKTFTIRFTPATIEKLNALNPPQR
jgi:ketosteroid isomerase-like protein